MSESMFPPGTRVKVTQSIRRRGETIEASVVGVVEAWENKPTGSWYAHGKRDKLWLKRLRLRKDDGEIVVLVMDSSTRMGPAEDTAASASA